MTDNNNDSNYKNSKLYALLELSKTKASTTMSTKASLTIIKKAYKMATKYHLNNISNDTTPEGKKHANDKLEELKAALEELIHLTKPGYWNCAFNGVVCKGCNYRIKYDNKHSLCTRIGDHEARSHLGKSKKKHRQGIVTTYENDMDEKVEIVLPLYLSNEREIANSTFIGFVGTNKETYKYYCEDCVELITDVNNHDPEHQITVGQFTGIISDHCKGNSPMILRTDNFSLDNPKCSSPYFFKQFQLRLSQSTGIITTNTFANNNTGTGSTLPVTLRSNLVPTPPPPQIIDDNSYDDDNDDDDDDDSNKKPAAKTTTVVQQAPPPLTSNLKRAPGTAKDDNNYNDDDDDDDDGNKKKDAKTTTIVQQAPPPLTSNLKEAPPPQKFDDTGTANDENNYVDDDDDDDGNKKTTMTEQQPRRTRRTRQTRRERRAQRRQELSPERTMETMMSSTTTADILPELITTNVNDEYDDNNNILESNEFDDSNVILEPTDFDNSNVILESNEFDNNNVLFGLNEYDETDIFFDSNESETITTTPTLQEPVPLLQEAVPLLQEPVPLIQEPVPLIQEPVPLIQEAVPLLQEPVPLFYRTSTWFIILLLLQIIFHKLWFKYILTSTVFLSYILQDLYGIEKHYDKDYFYINDNNTITPIPTSKLRTATLTLESREVELKIKMAKEKEMHKKLLDITDQINNMVSDDDDDVEEMDESEIASIQNRMDTLQPYIEYLESIQDFTGEEIIQEQIKNKDDPTRPQLLDLPKDLPQLLDLSKNQFVVSLFKQDQQQQLKQQKENIAIDKDNGSSSSSTTNSNIQNDHDKNNNNVAEFVQRSDVDDALATLNDEINDRVYSIIYGEEGSNDEINKKDQVLNWIRTERNNYFQNLKDKGASKDAESNMNTDKVKCTINERIMKVYGDITNRIDYASKYNGGIVLYSTLSLVDTLPIFNRIASFLNLRFYGHTAPIAITPNYYNTKYYKTNSILGQCWSFIRIKPAMLMIQLSQTIHVESVLIEHPLLSKDSMTTNTIRNSSIQTFHVYGHEETDKEYNTNHHHQSDTTRIITILNTTTHTMLINNGWYYLGTFHYDQSNILPGTNGLVEYPVLQIHQQQIDTKNDDGDINEDHIDQLTKPIPPLRCIQLFIDPILDTTDPYDYTCLYRFRVHGTPI